MHDKKLEQGKTRDAGAAVDQLPAPGKEKTEGKMPTSNGALQAQSNGAHSAVDVGVKSASLRQCKSFNSKESNLVSKAPKSHENSKISSRSNGAAALSSSCCNGSKVDAPPPSRAESNGCKVAKFSKSEAAMSKPKQSTAGTLKADIYVQPTLGRSEKVKSPGILKNSSSKVNVESQKKNSRVEAPAITMSTGSEVKKTASSKVLHIKAKETSPKPALAHVKSLSLSLNADPQKKLPPIKTSRTGSKSATSTAKNTANLCTECKAEVEGAVCFIGNDGRVSACTSRNAVRLCKNLKCANNNPEYVDSLAAAIAAPKKYLVSRRHSLNLPRSTGLPNGKNVNKAVPEKNVDVQTSDENGDSSQDGEMAASLPPQLQDESTDEFGFDMKGELEEDVGSLEEDLSGEMGEIDGIASASPNGGRLNGYQRMRRRPFSVIETQAPAEVVTLRKKMMQERKQAEEWMLDYAIEEALQKLAPSKDSRVKALVEAFESIIPNKEADAAAAVAQDHQPEAPKTPNKIGVAVAIVQCS